MNVHLLSVAGNPELQDRVDVFRDGERTLLALADGAGGMSGAAQAAELIIQQTREHKSSLRNASDCESLLHNIDRLISDDPRAGESTGIVLIIDETHIFGASVGDSEAWLFSGDNKFHLTKGQFRKPFLGSGESLAVNFSTSKSPGILIVASDGLWKYTSYEKVAAEIQKGLSPNLPEQLVSLVRLRSGALQDDVAIAIIEISEKP